jgi:translocator protein
MMEDLLAGGALPLVIAGAAALFVAIIGGVLTVIDVWYENLAFPSWRPPNWLFGPAWTIIFALTAAGGVVAWNTAPGADERMLLLALFLVNGVLNVAWSAIFFRMRRPDFAFFELVVLWLSILSLVVVTASWSDRAALLLLPYLAWVTFAGTLNRTIVRLNAPF